MIFSSDRLLSILCSSLLLLSACSPGAVDHWIEAVPESTPILFVFDGNGDLEGAFNQPIPVLAAQASNTNNAEILRIVSEANISGISLQAMAVMPANADEWKPVWIFNAPDGMAEKASSVFSRPQTMNGYTFEGSRIYLLYLTDTLLFYALESGEYLFISESSYAIESFARTLAGIIKPIDLDVRNLQSGKWFVNMPHFDDYLTTETAVRYRPSLDQSLIGSGIASLTSSTSAEGYQFTGSMPFNSNQRSNLVKSVTNSNHKIMLDRLISQDAALAVFMHGKAQHLPALKKPIELDVYLSTRPNEIDRLEATTGDHFALVAFGSSGYLGVGEFAYIRQAVRPEQLRSLLLEWVDQRLIQREGDRFIIQSSVLSWLISGGLANMELFHLVINNDIIIITQRPALIPKLITDRERRRTLYYNEQFLRIRSQYPDEISGFVYTQSESMSQFIEPLLNTSQSTGLLFDRFDIASAAFERSASDNTLLWDIRTFQIEQNTLPYNDRWLVRLDGTELVDFPVLADIAGNPRDEILIATKGGSVIALAADGTEVFRVNTGIDQPVGSPVAYDWYANNQIAILQGAGNKIYGWGNNGTPLPGFPIILPETLSAPIRITDITRNGIPEIIAATADRRLHVLDQRGTNINGWPQTLNASIRNKPMVANWLETTSIIAYAENVLFAFEPNGLIKHGFPLFNRAPFKGEMMIHNGFLISGSADGTIVSIGRGILFPVGTVPIVNPPSQTNGELTTQGLRLADGGLTIRPEIATYAIRFNDESVSNEPVLFAISDVGSLFAINMSGQLRFTQSLGQPTLPDHPPLLVDIDRNGQFEIMGIAGFGRMYAWRLISGDRFLDIPTTSLHRPIFADINGNGSVELVAGTNDGLRAWTINRN